MAVEHESNFFLSQLVVFFDSQSDVILRFGLESFTKTLGGTFAFAVNIAVALLGFQVISGVLPNLSLQDVLKFFVKLNIIAAIFYNIVPLTLWLHDVLTTLPITWAANLIQDQTPGRNLTIYQQLDQIYISGASRALDIGFSLDAGKILLGVALFLAATALICQTTVFVLGHKVVLIILLLLSPLFVGLMLFSKTAGITEAWIKQLVASFLTIFFVLMMVVVTISVGTAIGAGNSASTVDVTKTVLMMIVASLFVAEMPGLARQISGGVSVESGMAGYQNLRNTAATFMAARRQGAIERGLNRR